LVKVEKSMEMSPTPLGVHLMLASKKSARPGSESKRPNCEHLRKLGSGAMLEFEPACPLIPFDAC